MLNEALKQIRRYHKMNQSGLADLLGISKSYLSEIESKKKNASIVLLEKYAEIFNMPASSLLMFSENINAKRAGDKIRRSCTRKIIKIMEWLCEKDQKE